MVSIREQFYIPLRILSILCSPATQLSLWCLFFLWALFIKKSKAISCASFPIIASLITTNAVIRFIKIFFGRSRPDMFLSDGVYSLQFLSFERVFSSFPSGHASVVASIFGYYAAKYPKYSLLWIAATVAFSLCRVGIEAHFLSDVLFGNYLGFVYTWMFYFAYLDKTPPYLFYLQGDLLWKLKRPFTPSFKIDGPQGL